MDISTVYKMFPTQEACLNYIEKVKWNNDPVCPYCNSKYITKGKNEKKYNLKRYHCNKCNTTFSVLVNTIFQDTKLELQKWFLAIHLILNKKGKSSRKLANNLNVNHKTAWMIKTKIYYEIKQGKINFLEYFDIGEEYV